MGHTHVAIVGDGVGALILLAVLRHAGMPHGAAAIYGDGPHPLANLARYATSVRQETMRSEGDGHLSPRNFPDLALIGAWRSRSIKPLLATLFNAYNPPLDLVLEHAASVAKRFDFEAHRVRVRIGCLRRSTHSLREFDLFDVSERPVGRARHVVLALGHPGLLWPAEFESRRGDPRVAHAYENPTLRPGERVVVVGGGIGAAHLWLAALDAGAEVIALHREPLFQQALNAPRCAFTAAGIDAYRRLSPAERLARLQADRGSSYPWRLAWELQLWRARNEGRFRAHRASLAHVEPGKGMNGRLLLWFDDRSAVEADRLIFATGFRANARGHPLIRQIVDEYRLNMIDGFLQPEDDFTLPPLSRAGSVCAVIGALSRWALPIADTFAGMKYAARRLAPRLGI